MTNGPDSLYVDGNLIKKVKSFRYLGSIIEIDRSSSMDIRKRICGGQKVMGMSKIKFYGVGV